MFTASDQSFIILQSTLLTGITNVSFSQQTNEEVVNLISSKGITRQRINPTVTNCKITKKYLGEDVFRNFTGFVGLSGQFVYGSDALDFDDAVISNYSISMDTQSAPTVSVNLKIYGDLKPATTIRKSSAAPDYTVRDLNANSVSFDFMGKTVPITDFSFSANFNTKQNYEISSINSSSVKMVSPVQLSSSVKMELTEQEFEDLTLLTPAEENRQFSFGFHDSKVIDKILSESGRFFGIGLNPDSYTTARDGLRDSGIANFKPFEFSGFSLTSQDISVSPNDTIKLDSKYQAYLINLPNGNGIHNHPPNAPRIESRTTVYNNDFELLPVGGIVADQDSDASNNAVAVPKLTDSLGNLQVFSSLHGTGTIAVTSGDSTHGFKSLKLNDPQFSRVGITFSGFAETGDYIVSGGYKSQNSAKVEVIASSNGSHNHIGGTPSFQQQFLASTQGAVFCTAPIDITTTNGFIHVIALGNDDNEDKSVNFSNLVVEKINRTDTDISAKTGRLFSAVNSAITTHLGG